MLNLNCSPSIVVFYGESLDDLNLMPTTTKVGEGKYNHGFAPAGSIAEILLEDELKVYMLRTNGWVDVSNSEITDILF